MKSEHEPWHSFHDIFVRHAFGSYLDVLREVSYHAMMAQYLTFYKSRAFSLEHNPPDENVSAPRRLAPPADASSRRPAESTPFESRRAPPSMRAS